MLSLLAEMGLGPGKPVLQFSWVLGTPREHKNGGDGWGLLLCWNFRNACSLDGNLGD